MGVSVAVRVSVGVSVDVSVGVSLATYISVGDGGIVDVGSIAEVMANGMLGVGNTTAGAATAPKLHATIKKGKMRRSLRRMGRFTLPFFKLQARVG